MVCYVALGRLDGVGVIIRGRGLASSYSPTIHETGSQYCCHGMDRF